MKGSRWAVAAMAVVGVALAATPASANGKAKGRCVSELARAGLSSSDVNPGKANFIIGTEDDEIFRLGKLTDGVDVVCGFGGNDRVERLSEGDIFLGGAERDFVDVQRGGTFNGGDGGDAVERLFDGRFNGGEGDDFVRFMSGGTYNGDEGNDMVNAQGGGTFNGGEGNDSINSLAGGTFNGGEGNDFVVRQIGGRFSGGPGHDYLIFPPSGGIFNQD